MSDLDFDLEWEDVEGARGRELRVTWARFALRVGDVAVTEAYDARARSVREHLLIPLYPLAEWIATHWWPLLHEPEAPGRSDYARRHNLRYCREGFAFPNLAIKPAGEQVNLEWWPLDLPAERLRFARMGSNQTSLEMVRDKLAELVSTVIDRLDVQGVGETLLHQEWEAVTSADEEEAAFCIAAARMGADPYGLGDERRDELVRANELLPEAWRDEFFAAAAPSSFLEQAQTLLEWRDCMVDRPVDTTPLIALRKWCRQVDARRAPWEEGYAIARELRAHLGLDGRALPDDDSLAGSLGISDNPARFADRPLLASSFDALVDVIDCEAPSFRTTKRHPVQIRFAFARALFEYLTALDRPSGIVTSTRTGRQKRSRAFAAEFLAPAALIRERLVGEQVDPDALDELAAELGVSGYVVQHQVENHGLGRVVSY